MVTSVGSRVTAPPAPAAPGTAAATVSDPRLTLAALEHEAGRPVSRPVRIVIPSLGVDAPVVDVGLDAAGAVAVPDDISTVGWYKFGVAPGSHQGSAVIVGHRDGTEQGHGALYDLALLDLDDKLAVTTETGERLRYRVISRESVSKSAVPMGELFAVDGEPVLTLITCGGYYDRENGGYQDNVIVSAVRDYSA